MSPWLMLLPLLCSLCLAGCGTALSPTHDQPLRLMIVGDSITQGNPGEWTWRYRLYQHLQADKEKVDFVGPRDDLGTAWGGHLDYLDPDFDRDHAALGGSGLSTMSPGIAELVRTYRPDVVLLLMGVNDLVFFRQTPVDVRDLTNRFVADARRVDPSLDFVLGRLTPAAPLDVGPTDALVSELGRRLDTARSRVVVARPDAGFSLSSDTYDGVHPTAQGEVKIAAAFADALAELHVGRRYPRPLPAVPNGPRLAPQLVGGAGNGSVTLFWSGSPGSDREYVWLRKVGQAGWSRLPDAFTGARAVVPGLQNGTTYEIELQPAKGSHAAAADVRSNLLRLTPTG